MILGAHLSISGGMENALLQAASLKFQTVSLFVRNQVQWKAPKLADSAIEKFRDTRKQTGISPVVAHASYLINLAGADDIRAKSIAAMAEDVGRCSRLGIEYLVFHPGSRENVDEGISLIAAGLDEIVAADPDSGVTILLETTAGQGNCLGAKFEELSAIISAAKCGAALGVCLDTCHIFAAGYDIRTPEEYRRTMEQFEQTIGIDRLKVIHANDSQKDLASHVDRHAHIGKGKIGECGFANLAGDGRLRSIPFILETPKGVDENGVDMDAVNADILRRLAGQI